MSALVLIGAGALLWSLLPRTMHQVVPPQASGTSVVRSLAQPVPVSLQSVAETAAPRSLEVTGVVHSEWEAVISSKVMARVQSVLVHEGDPVHRGQTLILLDARDLDAALSQASANLRSFIEEVSYGYLRAEQTDVEGVCSGGVGRP